MEIYVIRHAESELNRDRRFVGGRSSWCEINELGRRQARVLGEALTDRGIGFDAVATSTAVRTQQTARYCLEAMGMPPYSIAHYDPDFLEISMGAWEGQPRKEVYTDEALAKLRRDAWNFAPPQGESQREVARRMQRALARLVVAQPEGVERVAVFTHGFAIRCLLISMSPERRPQDILDLVIANTSINHLILDLPAGFDPNGDALSEGMFEEVAVNDIRHLYEAKVPCLDGTLNPDATTPE